MTPPLAQNGTRLFESNTKAFCPLVSRRFYNCLIINSQCLKISQLIFQLVMQMGISCIKYLGMLFSGFWGQEDLLMF